MLAKSVAILSCKQKRSSIIIMKAEVFFFQREALKEKKLF